MSKNRILTKHHLFPKSRFKDGRTVWWDRKFHEKYHQLFGNMTIEEAITMLREVSQVDDAWDRNMLNDVMRKIKSG